MKPNTALIAAASSDGAEGQPVRGDRARVEQHVDEVATNGMPAP